MRAPEVRNLLSPPGNGWERGVTGQSPEGAARLRWLKPLLVITTPRKIGVKAGTPRISLRTKGKPGTDTRDAHAVLRHAGSCRDRASSMAFFIWVAGAASAILFFGGQFLPFPAGAFRVAGVLLRPFPAYGGLAL